MSKYYKRIIRKWSRTEKPEESLDYIVAWVDSLVKELRRSKTDEEFIKDLLEASYDYFISTYSDEEKADAFVYALGCIRKIT